MADDETFRPYRRARAPAPEPPPPDPPDFDAVDGEECPVDPLGHKGSFFYYMNPAGEVLELRAGQHRSADIDGLFLGDIGWLVEVFPTLDRKGRPEGGYAFDRARVWLMRACHQAGYYDPALERGTGTWRTTGGALIVHCGDLLFCARLHGELEVEELLAGVRLEDGFIYKRCPVEARPALVSMGGVLHLAPATALEGRQVMGFLGAWNWRQPALANRILLGYIMSAYVPGALHWRPHVLVAGDRGTGKSLLEKFLLRLLGGEPTVLRGSAPTAAGVRMSLAGSAKAVFLDELENKPDSLVPREVLEVVRLGSTEDQSPVLRGSTEGRASAWRIRGSFYISAINPPPMTPAETSRITALDLDQLEGGPEARAAALAGVEELGALGPGLRARAILGLDRFAQNFAVLEVALAEAGCDSRQIDQHGSTLAWAEVAISDAVIAPEAAEALVAELLPAELLPAQEDDSDAEQCLARLLSTQAVIEALEGGRYRKTIGETVHRSVYSAAAGDVLRVHGLRVMKHPATGLDCLVVANRHRGLEPIYGGTQWQGGGHKRALERLRRGEERTLKAEPINFGGVRGRGVWVPLAWIPDEIMAKPTPAADPADQL